MIRRPPGSTRTDTLFPDTTLFRSMLLATFNDREFVRVANVVGHPDWADDVRFSRSASRVANRRILAECLQEALSSRSTTEWIEKFNAAKVSCGPINRSEEHTSELQSLMRTSYAVFCLKKNTH